MKFKHLLGAAALSALIGASVTLVVAQVLVPLLNNVGTSDLFQDIQNGNVNASGLYVTAQQINGVPGYTNAGVLATGQSLTFGNSTTEIYAKSSGTIAALTLTASALPGDGQRNCYFNIAATTAITWNANTGQTISNAPTAGVANTAYCMTYSAATKNWDRSQ